MTHRNDRYQDVAEGKEGGHLWIGGQAQAAADNGVEIQWCMAGAHQVLESSQFNAVTSARVNGDGGLDIVALTLPAVLAATVGLGWSKDNLRTADRCYVDGLFPNGTSVTLMTHPLFFFKREGEVGCLTRGTLVGCTDPP